MLKFIYIFLCLFLTSTAFSQTFTRVMTGDIVNDGKYSEGAAWLDYNNDGLLDMLVSNITDQNNALYRNNGNGTFTTITTGSIVTDAGFTYGSTFGDFDNDGDVDIFMANGGGSASQNNFYYTNNGNGTFTRVTAGAFVNEVGHSWGTSSVDYDNDGKLDIFTSNFNQNNFLYKGAGDGSFSKITTGDIVNDGGHSITSAWSDYDNDGDMDLYVANGTLSGPQNDFFYENNGNGTFTKITAGALVTDGGNSVGASWGDYNNDGYMDLFVTNYGGENNFLYRNNGDRSFTKITTGAIVTDGGASVGSTWGDCDNDGDLDLFVANDNNQNDFLYTNNGDGSFTKVVTGDPVDDGGRSNGSVWGDLDNDGDLDLFVTNGNTSPVQNNYLFMNNGNANHWLKIKCRGTVSNRSAIGARVRVKAVINGTPTWLTREVSGQTGYNAQNPLDAHFGLGNAVTVDSIWIKWPSGDTDVYTNITADRSFTAVENSTLIGINTISNYAPSGFKLDQNYPNPFNPSTNISFSISEPSYAVINIYDLTGKLVQSLLNSQFPAGDYSASWNATNISAGVYFYTLTAGSFKETKKMLLVK